MTDSKDPTPRRAASDAGDDFDGLYRSSGKPARAWDDDSKFRRETSAETIWRAENRPPPPQEDVPVDDTPTHVQPRVTARSDSSSASEHEHTPPPPPKPPRTKRKREKFRRSVAFTILSTLIPGLGLIGSRQRPVRVAGVAVAGAFVAAVVAVGVFFSTRVTRDEGESWIAAAASAAAGMAAGTGTLHVLTVALITVGLVWVALIAATHVATRPGNTPKTKRAFGGLLVTVLSLVIATPTAVGASYAQVLASTLGNTFAGEDDVVSSSKPTLDEGPDPFAGLDRLNILLLGADMDEKRLEASEQLGYGLRTDTIMLASIDTSTGDIALVQIPRNVQYTPFPDGSEMADVYPDGFTGPEAADNYYINTIWETVEAQHPELFEGQTFPGAEGLKQGVEGITGLDVHYFLMLNIDGLRELVDAMGGVTVNVNERLPIGGSSNNPDATTGWIEPGPDQHLDGYHALWYARSRWASNEGDYSRMARQSCLIDAVVDQANPVNLLTRFEAIAGASSDMINTDIPAEALEALVDLGLKAKEQPMQRVLFTQGKNGYNYSDPDFEAMRAAVDELINPPDPEPQPTDDATSPSPSESASETEEPTADPSDELADGTQDVEDACAYNPS